MKKLRLLVLLCVAGSLAFNGCKKGDGDPEVEVEAGGGITTPGGKTCTLTKQSEEGGTYYETYEYDSQNRVVKVKEYDGNVLDDYTTISYGSSQIVVKDFEGTATQADETTTYNVSNGMVTGYTETETYTNTGGVVETYASTYTFEHNSEGYLTKSKQVSTQSSTEPGSITNTYTYETTFTYSNGNLVSEVESYGSGDVSTTTYEYYADIKNTLVLDDNLLISKPNKNAVKKATRSTVHQGQTGSTSVTNYTYVVNSDKLITKSTRVEVDSFPGQSSQTHTEIMNYEYSCK